MKSRTPELTGHALVRLDVHKIVWIGCTRVKFAEAKHKS